MDCCEIQPLDDVVNRIGATGMDNSGVGRKLDAAGDAKEAQTVAILVHIVDRSGCRGSSWDPLLSMNADPGEATKYLAPPHNLVLALGQFPSQPRNVVAVLSSMRVAARYTEACGGICELKEM
jgi:hypothetical protein